MPNNIKFLDTFSGIGGFHLGLKEAAAQLNRTTECVGIVEINDKSRNTYLNNFKVNNIFIDITKVDPTSYEDFDILFGGFPCQPFSRNGKIYNFQNTNNKNYKSLDKDIRSNLITYLFDILLVKKPKIFIFENVKELITVKNKDGSNFFDNILLTLKSCDYNVYYKILDSKDFGLPQQRRRVYIVGIRNDLVVSFKFPNKIQKITKIEDILEQSTNPKYLLNNLWKNRHNKILSGKRLDSLTEAYNSKTWAIPTKETNKITPLAIIYGDTPSKLPRQQDKLYSIKGISPTIATFSTPSIDSPEGWRQLTPRECARLQGFPDNFILDKKDSECYKEIGNAVSVSVVKEILISILNLGVL